MRCKPFFCNIIHPSTSDLYLNPFSVWSHHSKMQCLITISLRMAHPIPDAIGTQLIYISNCRIYVPTLFFLINSGSHFEYYANSKQVIYLVEFNAFLLHLIPNRINRFYPCTHFILDIHFIKRLYNRYSKVFIDFISLRGSLLNFPGQVSKYLRMLILKTELF